MLYLVRRCFDCDGELMYRESNVIGVYNNYELAKDDLISKLAKLKYTYEINFDHITDTESYFFATMTGKNGKEFTNSGTICFEIIGKKLDINGLKMKS